MNAKTLPIAITPGDPCGIGPEIVARAWLEQPQLTRGCFVAGDAGVMRRALALLPGAPTCSVQTIDAPAQALTLAPGLLPVPQVVEPVPALVTAPLHKEALHAAGAPWDQYPGHTELLQAESARHAGVTPDQMPVRMMLANEELRTVLVSIHVSLRQALNAITPRQVLQTLEITHQSLRRLLGRAPRIAVAGVNPHAGEGGLFGREEIEILQPVIAQACQRGMDVHGPFAPDTVFMRARHAPGHPGEFDVVVAMYHDQGLIPVKYLGVEQGVNVTLGLPLIRTSPDHGTAFDIAGQGCADARSLLQALRMARQLAGQG